MPANLRRRVIRAIARARAQGRNATGPTVAIWAASLAICACFIAFSAVALYNLRTSALRQAESDLARYSLTLAEQADRSFKSVDLVTLSIADYITRLNLQNQDALTWRLGQRDIHDLLIQNLSGLPQVDAITVINAEGKLLNFTRYWPIPEVNISDRDYFKALKADPKGTTFLSEPAENRGTGTWTIYLARRLNGPDGEFFGLVLGAMTLQYFEDFYRLTAPSDASAVALLRHDGMMLARSPKTTQVGKFFPEAAKLIRAESSGTLRDLSPIDGQMRLKAAHSLRNYPLFVLATQTEASALQEWYAIAKVLISLCAGAVTITLVSTFFVSRWWHQQILLRSMLEQKASADSARARAESELLRERSQRAEASNQAKSAFLAVMSHEMRTPLNGVIGALDLLQRTQLDREQSSFVEAALNSSEALLAQISDVLDFSKMEAGRLELEYSGVNVRQLASSLFSIVGTQASARGNTLTLSVEDALPPLLTGDPVRLRQILLNFLSNAVKFTSHGNIRLEIARRATDPGAMQVEFSVADTGDGIPSDRIESLFNEFSMVDASYSRNAGGTGLGLAISKRLVTTMGGEIGVESEVGKGSRFWFRIPLTEWVSTPSAAIGPELTPVGPARPLDILLVDDNPTNLLVVGKMLEAAGHRITTGANGREALAAARDKLFDVVFMDISMPEMDGMEATRRIRLLPQPFNGVPIIALTANAVAGDRGHFISAGMNDYVTKPVRRAQLDAILQQYTANRKAEAAEPVSSVSDASPAIPSAGLDTAPLIDLKELQQLAAETSPEIVQSVITEFFGELDERLETFSKAVAAGEIGEIARISHAIAGSAAAVGALQLRQIAKRIETDCKTGNSASALALGAQLCAVAERTKAALREMEEEPGCVAA
ncbi:MAG: response regulator [Hyphomicrobiales bacterium]|nr:MAG: response regulator [Hyphomicrobiales bacterium]